MDLVEVTSKVSGVSAVYQLWRHRFRCVAWEGGAEAGEGNVEMDVDEDS